MENKTAHVFDLTKTETHRRHQRKLSKNSKICEELLIVGTKVQTQKNLSRPRRKQVPQASLLFSPKSPHKLQHYQASDPRIQQKSWRTSKLVRLTVSQKRKKLWSWLVSLVSRSATKVSKISKGSRRNICHRRTLRTPGYQRTNVLGLTVFAILGTTGQPKLCDHFCPCKRQQSQSLSHLSQMNSHLRWRELLVKLLLREIAKTSSKKRRSRWIIFLQICLPFWMRFQAQENDLTKGWWITLLKILATFMRWKNHCKKQNLFEHKFHS